MAAATPPDDPRRTGLWPDAVLRARGRVQGAPLHVAPLSLHTTLAGHELYLTSDARHAVDPGRYLLLNAGQTAATFVEPGTRVESLSVLFSRALAADVGRALAASDEALLDDPGRDAAPPGVFERTYALDVPLAGALTRLRAAASDDGAREEALHGLLAALLDAQRGARAEAQRVPARRPATRVELYRRLCRARDLLDATPGAPVPLLDLGRAACLSPHRLLRLFQAAFGETPHRYHVRRRLERAHALLARGMPVAETARLCGFESAPSFSTLFRARFGLPPRRVRAEKGNFR